MTTQSYLSVSSAADPAAEPTGDIRIVQLDGLVVLKIIKHCQDNLPYIVTGQLLGLDIGHPGSNEVTLEVTNCFAFPSRSTTTTESEEEEEAEEAGAEYQMDMMTRLREVNVDSNTVGWYTSTTYPDSFLNKSLFDTQYNYQTTLRKSVLLAYDPVKTSQGVLSLRAYRLTPLFMSLYAHEDQFTKEKLEAVNMGVHDIFEEIPIKIHNSQLVNALLYDLETSSSASGHFERLNLGFGPFLEKNLEHMTENLEKLASEQSKLQYYQKSVQRQQAQIQAYKQKKASEGATVENEEELQQMFKAPQPVQRLDSLLAANQIYKYCEQVNKFAGSSFAKLFLYAGIQK